MHKDTSPSPAAQTGGFSAWFIARPVATMLLTIAIVLTGVLAFPLLSVAPLPEADFPTIQVSASVPGASAETMASSVATQLEVAFTGIAGMSQITSTSSLGRTTIEMQFDLDKDIDTAAQEVQAAINSVSGRLPKDMPNLPTWRKVNPADGPILILSANSDDMPLTELSDLMDIQLGRQISQINGVAQVMIIGQQKPAIRVQAAPDRLAAYGLSLADVRAAIQGGSINLAKGSVYGQDTVSVFDANDQLFTPEEYADIVIAWRNGAPVRIGDVARVHVGPEDAYVRAFPNGKPGVGLLIRRQPGANIVQVVDAIQEALPTLTAALPASVDVSIMNDRTRTIRASLHEVELTLILTFLLVVFVMGLFLRQLSATLIVGAVLGVAVIATFGAMYLLGFSLNNLTLVALIIAVGFVVDDTIVVVENIHRHLEMGKSKLQAALDGAREIGFTVVSITFSLIAAFIPLLFMGGVVGRLFREFSLTVTATLLISVVVALTFAPMLCSQYMNPPRHDGKRKRPLITFYAAALRKALDYRGVTLLIFFLTIAATVVGYILTPKGFFPLQDTAAITGQTTAVEDISFDDMRAKHRAIEEILAQEPAIEQFNSSVGASAGSPSLANGRLWIVLKDRGDRDASSEEVIARLRPKLAAIPGIIVSLRSSQDINLGVGAGGSQYTYVLQAADTDTMALWTERLSQEMAASPIFRDVNHNVRLGMRKQAITIDRAALARYGLTVEMVDEALYDSFGQRQVRQFQTDTNQYWVILEVDPAYFARVASLDTLFLRAPAGNEMIPLSAVARIEPQKPGPLLITRYGLSPAASISFNLPENVALSQAMAEIDGIKNRIGVPAGVTGVAQGSAQAFEDSLATQPLLILAAIIAVYIILGVLYESYSTPLTILSTLPSAGLGALLMLWLFKLDFSVMALIGIIMLIGIVKKNGILMVDFALDAQRQRGLSAEEAIYEAAVIRFRPILMTTIAAMLAAVPLMLAIGTGAELRQPLGVAVVGGLLISQVLTLFTTPVVYIALDRLFHRKPSQLPRVKQLLEGGNA